MEQCIAKFVCVIWLLFVANIDSINYLSEQGLCMRNKLLGLQAFPKRVICSLDLMADPNRCKFEDNMPNFKLDDIFVYSNGTKTFSLFGRANAYDLMIFKLPTKFWRFHGTRL